MKTTTKNTTKISIKIFIKTTIKNIIKNTTKIFINPTSAEQPDRPLVREISPRKTTTRIS